MQGRKTDEEKLGKDLGGGVVTCDSGTRPGSELGSSGIVLAILGKGCGTHQLLLDRTFCAGKVRF
jgi:hypothetical protein